jgi:hypothetical protein
MLTDAKIRAAKPSEKPYKLFDAGGLYLEVSPRGGRWWRLKFRFEGREKRVSLARISHRWYGRRPYLVA